MHKIFALLFFIQSICLPAYAEDTPTAPRPDPIHWSKDRVFEEFISPWTTDARYYLLAGTGVVLGLLAFQDQLIYGTQESLSTRKPLGHFAAWGDAGGQLIPNALYAGGMYLFNDTNKAMLMIKATLYSSAVTTVMKYIVNEKRPNGRNRHSFPSGHTTTAFAFASTVASLHEWYWGASAYLFASFVGFSRINDNKHYIHDVVAGATIGAAYGVGVAAISKKYLNKDKSADKKTASLNVMPIVDQNLYGVMLNYEF